MPSTPDLDTNSTRVMIADPRSFMCGCLACWFDKFGGGFRAAVTADAVAALAEQNALLPELVILSAPVHPEGRAWLQQQTGGLRRTFPAMPIVAILDESNPAAAQEIALTLGLQGYIPMSSTNEVAVAVLRLIVAGGRYHPHAGAAVRPQPMAKVEAPPARSGGRPQLTPREQAVMNLLAAGMPNKLIARKLGIAVSTVKVHVHHILAKLSVQNRTEVAIWGRARSSTSSGKFGERRVSRQIAVEELR
jgi:two-component system, NarL family, nitrate/nitrite response regulator NarL